MSDTAVDETSFEEYKRITGKRFRISTEQQKRGLTREEALQERLASGDLKKFTKKEVSGSAWLDPELTLENFREKTGLRFRITPEQQARSLSREEAFQETLASKRSELNNA